MAIVTSLSNVQNLGDKIICRYTTLTSGAYGSFSELGTCTTSLIPPDSSATSDGSFYWVYVGKDYRGRMKFIADRNIQHSISWDVLNTAGICSEKLINLGLGDASKTSLRLLTGGTSTTDLDNEWDKIIVNSTLGGTITAGDNNVWNWNGTHSWCSTSMIDVANYGVVSETYRTLRGNTSSSKFTWTSSNYVGTIASFRPVLLVETLIINKFLLRKDSNYYTLKSPDFYDDINHVFLPLTLSGDIGPNATDIETFGFDSLDQLITLMTKGSDSFIPIDKLNSFELKVYKK